jgi:hypothetical protein
MLGRVSDDDNHDLMLSFTVEEVGKAFAPFLTRALAELRDHNAVARAAS